MSQNNEENTATESTEKIDSRRQQVKRSDFQGPEANSKENWELQAENPPQIERESQSDLNAQDASKKNKKSESVQ